MSSCLAIEPQDVTKPADSVRPRRRSGVVVGPLTSPLEGTRAFPSCMVTGATSEVPSFEVAGTIATSASAKISWLNAPTLTVSAPSFMTKYVWILLLSWLVDACLHPHHTKATPLALRQRPFLSPTLATTTHRKRNGRASLVGLDLNARSTKEGMPRTSLYWSLVARSSTMELRGSFLKTAS